MSYIEDTGVRADPCRTRAPPARRRHRAHPRGAEPFGPETLVVRQLRRTYHGSAEEVRRFCADKISF